MIIRALTITAAAIALSGCISLFPKAEPVTLYKLTIAPPPPPASSTTTSVVLRGPTAFTRIGSSDRIVTMIGAETATVAAARWAAPANVMFDEALVTAFDGVSSRLITRGDVAPADQILRVEVRSFEARYVNGLESAPTIVVEARASLIGVRDRTQSGARTFHVEQPASDNRVSAIVDAFNAATTKATTDIAKWTESQAPRR